jgi:hypothetical protein
VYAITASSYRAINKESDIRSGETLSSDIPQSLLQSILAEQVKAERSERLRATDWTQMPDAPLSAAQKSSLALYRQQLRDLPSVPGFPNVPWPEFPSLGSAADGNIKAPI